MLKNKKLLLLSIIIVIIIIAGIWIADSKGLNFSVIYTRNTELTLYIEKEFNDDDIKQIAEGVLGKDMYINRSADNDRIISITAKEISDEQKVLIVKLINEKYEIELDEETSILVEQNGNVRGRDIIAQYGTQVMIAALVVLAYLVIVYKRVGPIKVLLGAGSSFVATQGLYLSALAIFRIPINLLTMPISLLIFLVTAVGITVVLEKLKGELPKSPKKAK